MVSITHPHLTEARQATSSGPPASGGSRPSRLFRRGLFLTSPSDQPAWARPALLAIATYAALLYAWNIRSSGYATYYSVAVKSMSVSWKALLYGALDPGATITIDKLAGAFVPQALCARVFGYSEWALTLPQVVEGVVAVLVMYRIGRRWSGPVAGLLCSGILATTPIIASMFGHAMEDGALTMCLVCAADAFQRALMEARTRSLVLAGVWVGIGFQAKMLQAWMVLPAMAISYLFLAPGSARRRLAQLSRAGAVMVAVSLSWCLLYTLTPADDRPYVDGSTNNNAFAMVFGYNGLDRFGIHVAGAAASMFSQASAPAADSTDSSPARPGAPGGGDDGRSSALKMVSSRYVSQIGWLYPLAIVALVLGLARSRGATRSDATRANLVFWGLWLGTFLVVFSLMTIPHTAYLASLGPALAALGSAGIVSLWRAYRTGDGILRLFLPLTIVAELSWTLWVSTEYATFRTGVVFASVGLGLVAVPTLLLARWNGPSWRTAGRAVRLAVVAGVSAMLVVPAAWASSVLDQDYAGSAFDASAGPTGGMGRGMGAGPGGTSDATALSTGQENLLSYLTDHRAGATYVAATLSWNTAGPYITASGLPLMPLGGFSGAAAEPTLDDIKSLVAAGELRFFLLTQDGASSSSGTLPSAGTGGPSVGSNSSVIAEIQDWVTSTCAEVPSSDYGAEEADGQEESASGQGAPMGTGSSATTLYRCSTA